jgi:hypothetical protein
MNTLTRTALASALLVAACSSSQVDVKSAHAAGKGTTQNFEATEAELWTAAHAALRWNSVGPAVDHPDEHFVETNATSYDQVGVWFTPNTTLTSVTVVVMDDPNLPGPSEKEVLKDISTALDLERHNQPLDKRP